MKNRYSNWQIVVSLVLIFAVWFGELPVYAQVKQDSKGLGIKVVSELPSKEKRWALIVGIDEYQNDVSTLKGSVNDAKALKNVLVNNAGFPENQIILLTTDSAEQEKQPTRENILRALRDLHNRLDKDSLLLFSFSGHGISIGDQAFLIPSNGSFTKNQSLLEDFSIDVSRIKRAIQEIGVKQVLMLIDACRNEPGKGDTPNKLSNNFVNGFSFDIANSDVKAFATLYATSIGERAYEFYDKDSKQFRGYFSHAIEQALTGKAANEKGEVTLSGLIEYLETNVPKRVKFDKGETQIPMANYSETYRANQLILSVSKKLENNTLTYAQITWNNFLPIAKSLMKYDYIDDFSDELARVKLNDKEGFINKSGIQVIPLKYDSVGSFSDGLAVVIINKKYGLINKNGKEIIPPKFDIVTTFSEGLARVRLNQKWGFIDTSGQVVIPLKYDRVEEFSDGLACVDFNGKYGFIDKRGNEIIRFQYEYFMSFNFGKFFNGLTEIKINGKYGLINRDGVEIVPPEYESIFLQNGVAVAVTDGKEFLINVTNGNIISLKYKNHLSFYERVSKVSFNGKWGFIDELGNETIPLKYEDVGNFSEGLARVRINGKEGFINKNGVEVIKPKYDSVSGFTEGFAAILLNKKLGVINKIGNLVIPNKYDESVTCGDERFLLKKGYFPLKLNNKCGLIDKSGKQITEFKYDGFIDNIISRVLPNIISAAFIKESIYLIDKNGKEWKFLSLNEISGEWNSAFISEGFIGITKNGKKGFVDLEGNEYFDF